MLNSFEYSEDGLLFHAAVPRIMGSKLDVVAAGLTEDGARQVWNSVLQDCELVDNTLNSENPDSEISGFNSGKNLSHCPVSSDLYEAIERCDEYRVRTEGLFDVARGNMKCVDLSEEDESLSLYGAKIDFGSFAKGYLLDKVEKKLRDVAVESAFVNFGNSAFLAVGNHPCGEPWKVSLRNPYSKLPLDEIELSDSSCCVSCNAPGCVGHVYDPGTGSGIESRKMGACISRNVVDAKVLATALMVADARKFELLKDNFPEDKLYIYNL